MKYYKNSDGKIFPRNEISNDAFDLYEWRKVPESEYLLQEARKRYPVGTIFLSVHQTKQVISCGYFYYKEKATLEGGDCIYSNGWDVYRNGVWAEIISTTKEEKSESKIKEQSLNHMEDAISYALESLRVKKEVKMTHQEAIKELENITIVSKPSQWKAINYAIDQLNKCEVFPEPVEMEVSHNEDFWYKRIVIGKLNSRFIFKNRAAGIATSRFARPIKKEPLSFTEWRGKNNITRHNDGCGLWNDEFLNSEIREYTEYLNNFNK